MWRRRTRPQPDVLPVADDFREWVASLPYVVERRHGRSETARAYDVDCPPLDQRATWLILDFTTPNSPRPSRIEVILPSRLARKALRAGWGFGDPPLSRDRTGSELDLADRVPFRLDLLAGRGHIEMLVLAAYRSVIHWT